MTVADWYFDFVSPFSYLQLQRFHELPPDLEIRYVPVLFAGLLGHFGHKGPAEIELKRKHTYRQCQWYAERHGIRFRMPPAHPFNPLPLLREAVRLDASPAVVRALFRGVFEQGMLPDDDRFWTWCSASAGEELAARDAFDESVKVRLKANTTQAADRGIYGVPTFACGNETFWGVDSTELFIEYLADSSRFDDTEYRRLATLPIGKARQ